MWRWFLKNNKLTEWCNCQLVQMDFLHENYEAAEGASMPRSIIYSQYLRYCRHRLGNIMPMNPASFGKLLRLVFTGIKTRRLGTRLSQLCWHGLHSIQLSVLLPSVLWHCWKGVRPVKKQWWGAGVVICLERVAVLHMAQLMPLPLTVSCFSKIQIGFTFLVPAYPGSPELKGC